MPVAVPRRIPDRRLRPVAHRSEREAQATVRRSYQPATVPGDRPACAALAASTPRGPRASPTLPGSAAHRRESSSREKMTVGWPTRKASAGKRIPARAALESNSRRKRKSGATRTRRTTAAIDSSKLLFNRASRYAVRYGRKSSLLTSRRKARRASAEIIFDAHADS